jgi:hypothetical protein
MMSTIHQKHRIFIKVTSRHKTCIIGKLHHHNILKGEGYCDDATSQLWDLQVTLMQISCFLFDKLTNSWPALLLSLPPLHLYILLHFPAVTSTSLPAYPMTNLGGHNFMVAFHHQLHCKVPTTSQP